MKTLKIGITFIILGNVLYLTKEFFAHIVPTALSDFTQGFLGGFGVSINVIGIIFILVYLAKKGKI
ncbi:MAG TPA: hypothetical protein PLH70_06880 [Bacteroidales bacterium]|nr:hypothetical protein [Bacteroidales bacterium]HOH23263.1 hypothetical protein [Bacteroidales bacterium]HPZ03812.1 hypothetical protein [Bacteroidales bacterium]HQB75504.1 hypothetical protein [Bacteroidales bacterium]